MVVITSELIVFVVDTSETVVFVVVNSDVVVVVAITGGFQGNQPPTIWHCSFRQQRLRTV
jgi:hypothetical protein